MFFSILSIICVFGLTIFSLIFTILRHFSWYYVILISFGTFCVTLGLIFLAMCITTRILGKKYLKTKDYVEKKRRRLITDVSFFILFWMNIHIHTEGLEKLPKDETVVFYVNHQSLIDIFALIWVLRKTPFAFVFKEELGNDLFVGPIVQALGGEALDRKNNRSALESVIHVINKVKSGLSFLVYPEGTRSHGINIRPYKPGSFKIVEKSQVPMVVLTIDGLFHPYTSVPLISTSMVFSVTKVYSVEEVSKLDSQELAKEAEYQVYLEQKRLREKYWFLKPSKKILRDASRELEKNESKKELYENFSLREKKEEK